MKKFKLILCLCACVLGLTACGADSAEKVLDEETKAALASETQSVIADIYAQIPEEDSEEFLNYGAENLENMFSNYFGMAVDGNAIINGYNSWISASKEIGGATQFIGMTADYDDQGSDIIVKLTVQGTLRTAEVEAIYGGDINHKLEGITTNVNYTFGEKMSKAGLNTLMGMGTVFAVLILICLIISLFKYISVIQDAFTKKNKTEVKAEVADTAIAQIIEKEELTDDLELIAVITAAIAASGTSGSADDFVVRSIRRKANSQWNKA